MLGKECGLGRGVANVGGGMANMGGGVANVVVPGGLAGDGSHQLGHRHLSREALSPGPSSLQPHLKDTGMVGPRMF